MSSNRINPIVLAAGLLFSAGSVNAQEAARADPKTPSIIYYGDGLNQRVDQRQYFEGQQGQHLANMEEARRRKNATGYGEISAITGNVRTTYVKGHTRSDGTYVRPHYRSKR